MEFSVRRATPSEVDTVVGVLTAAFQDDPVSSWVFPDPQRRPVAHRLFFKAFTAAALQDGEVYLSGGDIAAALLFWTDGGESEDEFMARFAALRDDELERFAAVAELMSGQWADTVPHLHRQFLGVLPGHQNSGLGKAIVRDRLTGLDAEGIPCSLECSSATSARLYRRLGFVDHGEPFSVPGAPPMYPLWRDPRPS